MVPKSLPTAEPGPRKVEGEHSDPDSIISKYVEKDLDPEMESLVKYGMGTIYAGAHKNPGTVILADNNFIRRRVWHCESRDFRHRKQYPLITSRSPYLHSEPSFWL